MKKGRRFHPPAVLVLTFLISFLVCANPLIGEESDSQYRLNKEFFNQFGRDIMDTATFPGRWKGSDILKFSTVFGAGALMFCFDDSIQEWVRTNKTSNSSDAAGFLTQVGDGTFLSALIVSSYLSGEIFDDVFLRKVGLLSAESFIISAVLVNLLKFVVGRARPYANEQSYSFHPFTTESRYHSFPSGHASSAFSVATIIAEYSDNLMADVLVYTLAGLVAATRVHLDKHCLSDVFFGSAIGYFVGKRIAKLHRNGQSDGINVGIALTPRCQALTFSYSF